MKETDELLLAFADADQAHRPAREQFLVAPGMSPLAGVPVQHPELPENFRCASQAIDELEEGGYLRVEELGSGGSWVFDVTNAGLQHASRIRLALTTGQATEGGGAHPFDWQERVLPVLEAVGHAYSGATPDLGVSLAMVNAQLGRNSDDASTAAVLEELVRTGYLDETLGGEQLPGPEWCRLTEKGLQVTAGWPSASGEVALARLLAIIDERIDDATDDEERSKWENFRDGVLGVGRDVMVGVMTTAANAAAKGLL